MPFVIGLTGLLLFGCEGSSEAPETAAADAPRRAPPTPIAATARAEDKRADAPAKAPAGAAAAELVRLGDAEAKDDSRGARAERRARQTPRPGAGQLTAGRWSDRDDWGRWQHLLGPGSSYRSMLDSWNLGRLERVTVTLDGRNSVPVDTEVVLVDDSGRRLWRARTDNRGRADLYLHPDQAGTVRIRGADGHVLATRGVHAGEQHRVHVDADVVVASAVDLMFVVDTTGSMSDELSFLQEELTDIVDRVQRDSAQALSIRTSVNFYRDHGDAYVVRSHPFTTRLSDTLTDLRSERAGGGGDFPEALDAALSDAVRSHQWSGSAVARIMFVITDAPPHGGAGIGAQLQETTALAASMGIRIVPVASSGVDKPTEFLLRHLAVSTGGTYVFLTDHSGIGNGHIEPTVGPYTVTPLNDLLVEVIGEYTRTDGRGLVSAASLVGYSGHNTAHGYTPRRHGTDGWGYVALGLLIPTFMAGLWWRNRRKLAPVADARVARARRMLKELTQTTRARRHAEADSWVAGMREVVDGLEQLVLQQRAIDGSLRVAGMQSSELEATGVRAVMLAEVSRRRAEIDAEIDAGLASVEAAYLHVIGGVGERSTTQATLDAAREALQSRIDVERELSMGR